MRNAILNKLIKLLDTIAYKLEDVKKPVLNMHTTKDLGDGTRSKSWAEFENPSSGKVNLPLRYEDRY